MANCNKCGAPMAFNPQTGKNFCSAKCWLQNQQNTQNRPVSAPNKAYSATSIIINQVEKPHSYEFGPANNRHKIYYSEIAELIQHIQQLKNAELVTPINFEDEAE